MVDVDRVRKVLSELWIVVKLVTKLRPLRALVREGLGGFQSRLRFVRMSEEPRWVRCNRVGMVVDKVRTVQVRALALILLEVMTVVETEVAHARRYCGRLFGGSVSDSEAEM